MRLTVLAATEIWSPESNPNFFFLEEHPLVFFSFTFLPSGMYNCSSNHTFFLNDIVFYYIQIYSHLYCKSSLL